MFNLQTRYVQCTLEKHMKCKILFYRNKGLSKSIIDKIMENSKDIIDYCSKNMVFLTEEGISEWKNILLLQSKMFNRMLKDPENKTLVKMAQMTLRMIENHLNKIVSDHDQLPVNMIHVLHQFVKHLTKWIRCSNILHIILNDNLTNER